MDYELLRQADRVLSKCGRPILPDASVVCLERKIMVPMLLEPGAAQVFTQEITGDTTWCLRRIASDQGSSTVKGVRLQIQLPNGKFLIGGDGQDVGQFAWVGSWAYLMDPELDCDPGSKLQISLEDVGGVIAETLPVNLLFEGVDKYYFKPAPRAGGRSALDIPKYQGIVNENILAPCYTAGVGPETPAGYQDDVFTYSSPVSTLTIGATSASATLKIPIDRGLDFMMRRILVEVDGPGTATNGIFSARLRTGSGYAFNDDFIDLARYLNGAEFAKDWPVRGGDSVFVDVRLLDTAGTGALTFQVHLEGVKRRKL